MCEQLAAKARSASQESAWDLLRLPADEGGTPAAVELFLEQKLKRVAQHAPEHYNENAPLGDAIEVAVALAETLEGWPAGLQAFAEAMGASTNDLLNAEAFERVSLIPVPHMAAPLGAGGGGGLFGAAPAPAAATPAFGAGGGGGLFGASPAPAPAASLFGAGGG